MTNDRALQVLHVYASVNGSGQCTQDEFEEAKKMAIEALQRGLENVNADSCSESPNRSDLISRRDAINECKGHYRHPNELAWSDWDVIEMLTRLPSAKPDNRLAKIADLVEGTIDHFNLEDAMDLLYQIKEVLKNG